VQAAQVLHKLIMKTCPNLHQLRQTALEANVFAALFGRRLTVTDLGRSIQSETSHKHNIKRADRLLSNPHLHAERLDIYGALSVLIVGAKTRPIVLIDWSDMDEFKQDFLLRAAVAVDGRSKTLYEEIHTIESKEKPATHKHFLIQLQKLLPNDCRPILITDAGFRTPWFKLVEEMGWDWVGRIRNRHAIRWKQGGPWFDAKKCYKKATNRPTLLGEGRLTKRHEHPCQFIIYKQKAQGRKHKNRFGDVARNSHSRKQAAGQSEPWRLATSLPVTSTLAKKAVKLYRTRMQIEVRLSDMLFKINL